MNIDGKSDCLKNRHRSKLISSHQKQVIISDEEVQLGTSFNRAFKDIRNMICPQCSTAVKYSWSTSRPLQTDDNTKGTEIAYTTCPNCEEIVVFLQRGTLINSSYNGLEIGEVQWSKMIYPRESTLENTEGIPQNYYEDYEEALKVLSPSPKASAALTRRLLQRILREEYQIHEKTPSQEILKFIQLPGIPSHIN